MRDSTGTAIERVRRAQGISRSRLSLLLREHGCPIPEMGLQRMAGSHRRVDVTELVALAAVLGVHPVDLLVPADAPADQEFVVTDQITATVGLARAWIGGHALLPEPRSADELAEALRRLPAARMLSMRDRYREAS